MRMLCACVPGMSASALACMSISVLWSLHK